MNGELIPRSDHVVKHLSSRRYNSGNLDWNALTPRETDNGENSCNWMEHFENCSFNERLDKVRSTCGRDLGKNERFALLNVGQTFDAVFSQHRNAIEVQFTHQPDGTNKSHSVMTGIRHDDEEAGFILNRCVLGFHPAKVV